jgi:formate dehydrogenase major subunit
VTHTQTTCLQCSVGCTLDVVTRYSRLLRVDGVWDSDPNGGLLCVEGRFKPLYDNRKRIAKPMVRKDGKLVESSWDEALDLVAEKLSAGDVLGVASTATSNEALKAFGKLFKKLDAKAGRLEPAAPKLGYGSPATIGDVLDADFIVIAGADPLNYQPVIGYFIKRQLDNDVPVAVIGETDNELSERAMMSVGYDEANKVAEEAAKYTKPVVVYSVGLQSKAMAGLESLADKALFLALEPGRNVKGASAAGLLPLDEMSSADVVYYLMAEQPVDEALVSKLNGAFTIAQAAYHSPLVEQADVVLPTPIWSERAGHVTNLEGKVFPLHSVLDLPEGVRDDAEVLAALAAKLK